LNADEVFTVMNAEIEKLRFKAATPQSDSPIFLIGPPRSGSTLISQLMVQAYDLGYVNNFIARFWMAPQIGVAVSRSLGISHSSKLTSEFGRTSDIGDLHEFSFFWNRFFNDEDTHKCDQLPQHLVEIFRSDVNEMTRCWDREILFERDPKAIAMSLLNARRKINGSDDKWWSLKPDEFNWLKNCDPIEQVVGQVFFTYKSIFENFGPNFSTVNYDQIGSTLLELPFKRRAGFKLPELSISNRIRDTEADQIDHYIEKYFVECEFFDGKQFFWPSDITK